MRSRAERRKNPDQWWQVVSYFSDDVIREVPVGEDQVVYVRGDVADMTVVQLPDVPPSQLPGMMEGMTKALEAAGIMEALIIPHGIEMMKMRPVDPAKARALDRGQRVKQTPPKGAPS